MALTGSLEYLSIDFYLLSLVWGLHTDVPS